MGQNIIVFLIIEFVIIGILLYAVLRLGKEKKNILAKMDKNRKMEKDMDFLKAISNDRKGD